MPVLRLRDYRLRAGTYASTDISTTYSVENLTVQSDMDFPIAWHAPAWPGTTPPERVVSELARGSREDGYWSWQWLMAYMTNDMLDYWETTYLPNGVPSAAVSGLTYTRHDEPFWFQAVMHRGTGRAVPGGWADVTFRFTDGVQIDAPPEE